MDNSRNFNFQGAGFAQTAQNKDNVDIVNESLVNEHIVDHINNQADSIDEEEEPIAKVDTEEVEDTKVKIIDSQDYVESNE